MWNYRVVEIQEEDCTSVEVCEVYYDQKGLPMGYCRVTINEATVADLKHTLEYIEIALMKPVLKPNDFVGGLDEH
jgi:hypothetical protein